MTAPPSTGPARSGPSTGASDRRSYWTAGIVLFVAIAGLITVSVVTAPAGPRKDTLGQLQEQGGAKPHIIPRPGEGQAPQHPSDRGGWQQFLVLGLIVAGVGAIGGLAWRSGRRARAGSPPHRPSPPGS